MRLAVILLGGLLCSLSLFGQTLVISEFMADNRTGIADAEGDNSDWLEVENVSGTQVDLDGWTLTDDSSQLGKWTFPSLLLGPGERVLIFASGKDRRNPNLELHTNFQLANGGEYLALVRPDGTTVEYAYAPAYPPQLPDIAYGFAAYRESAALLSAATPVRYTVPISAAGFPAAWEGLGFNDAGWKVGNLALGFDVVPAPLAIATNLARGRSATQSSTTGSFSAARAVDGNLDNFSQTKSGSLTNALWDVNLGATYLIDQIVIRNRTDCCQSRLRDLVVSIRNAAGSTVFYESAVLNPENVLGSPSELRIQLTNELTGSIAGNRVRITRLMDADFSGGGTTADDAEVLSLSEVEVSGRISTNSLATIVRTDLAPEMKGVASGCLVRIPFEDPWKGQRPFEKLVLKLRYNDGYVAYLNGVEVARQNVRDPLDWDSVATTNRNKSLAFNFDTVDISRFASLVRSNGNVLALRGLSSGPSDGEFFLQPTLEAVSLRRESARFLDESSPGLANSSGTVGVVSPVEFSVPRGFYQTAFSLSLSTPTPGGEIRFTLNGSDPAGLGGIRYTNPIALSKTTPVRAIAVRSGWKTSVSVAHTYLFLDDVIRQTPQSTIAMGFPSSWGGIAADYGMDARVIGGNAADRYGGKYAATIQGDLRSLATLALTLPVDDMFGLNGIYSRSEAGGDAYERSTSAELIELDGVSGFQINAGLRIQGGAFRSDGLTKKHSLRLVFNSKHGPSKLRYPLFGEAAVDRFDTVTLRANSNDGYSWGDATGQPLYVRDSFGRESILDMNGMASHHKFVHLYINGVYWGMYEMVERPDSAFSASYFEGEREEWDSLNSGTPTEGDLKAWDAMMNLANKGLVGNSNYFRIQGRNPDGSLNPSLPNYLDVPNLIDYMIVNLYMGNTDWPHKNYWVGRRRVDSSGYKFYMWDAEWSMGLRSDLSTDQTSVSVGVAGPYAACRVNAEFKVLFGDRLQKHLFDGGALAVDPLFPTWDPAHPERNRPAARFARLTGEIRRAMVAESARWGDMHSPTPYTPDEHWAVEGSSLLKSYYPQRSDVLLQQFRRIGLYPSLNPPTVSLRGGEVQSGQTLLMGTPVGKVLYTLDGTDPRLIGGAPAPQALEYAGPIVLPGRSILKARVYHTNSWSALREVVFTQPEPMPLRITEIHYHPASELPSSPYFTDDSEFIELQNVGSTPLSLQGVRLTRGVRFDFGKASTRVLEPGARVVITRNIAAFEARYGPSKSVVGEFEGTLSNVGESLTLVSPFGETLADFAYSSAWYPTTDGMGFSLVSVEGSELVTDLGARGSWRPSSAPGGSPGTDDPVPSFPQVVISEVLARASNGGSDALELQNLGNEIVDISDWFLTDEAQLPKKYRFPRNTIIAPGGRVVVSEAEFDPRPRTSTGFAFSSAGDSAWLFSADTNGLLTGYVHGLSFGASEQGRSFVRVLTSDLREWAVAAASTTLGAPNSIPLIGDAVITRLNLDDARGGIEFVEIQNRTDAPLSLFDAQIPTNTWRLSGIGWTFPTQVTLPARGIAIAARSTPEEFRKRYPVPLGVQVFGPFLGSLRTAEEALVLQRPDPGVAAVRWITVDIVQPLDQRPWPQVRGTGAFLVRRSLTSFGPEPASWIASINPPGQPLESAAPPEIVSQSDDAVVRALERVTLTVSASGTDPLRYQWFHNGQPRLEGTNAHLVLDPVLSRDAGIYEAYVFGSGGGVISRAIRLGVLEAPQFTRYPSSRSVLQGTTVSLVSAASGLGFTRYQWLREGAPVEGATNAVLDIPSIQLTQAGRYALQITDELGIFVAPAVTLDVLSRPSIVDQPQSVAVLQGETAVFRVQVQGSGPLTFRWRKNGVVLANSIFIQNETFSTLVLTNVQSASAGRYSVQITNRAPTGTIVSSEANLVVLPDADGDGMEDGWETRHGFNPAFAGDADLDADGDGFSNREEYRSGTDPRSGASTLLVESIRWVNGQVELGWTAMSNRTYRVVYRDSLSGGAWQTLRDVFNRPTNRLERILDPVPSQGERYYQLTIP
jgi:hypothetical protein